MLKWLKLFQASRNGNTFCLRKIQDSLLRLISSVDFTFSLLDSEIVGKIYICL